MQADVLIPVKCLVESKSRLSDILSTDIRKGLVLAMLEDILATLQSCQSVRKIAVVTPDVIENRIVTKYDVHLIEDPPNADLNQAIHAATELMMKDSDVLPLLILPVDVPLVDSKSVNCIISKAYEIQDPVVISSPSRTLGTNALLRKPPNIIRTHFGYESFIEHKEQCLKKGIHFITYHSSELELDLDTMEDLKMILEADTSTITSHYLNNHVFHR